MEGRIDFVDPNMEEVLRKRTAALDLKEILTSSQSAITYDELESFGKPRFRKEVMGLIKILGEDLEEGIPIKGEVPALEKLAKITFKYLNT